MVNGEFVGADMAKKYLHMGFTFSRRYWNHSSVQEMDSTMVNGKHCHMIEPNKGFYDFRLIFQRYWKVARENKRYLEMKKHHRVKMTLGLDYWFEYYS